MFRIELLGPDDNTRNIITLYENSPSLEKIDRHIVLLENCQYKVTVQSDEIFSNIELFIGDYLIPLTISNTSGCYETPKMLLFEGCFDLVEISICISDNNDTEIYMYSDYIRVATTKQTSLQVYSMLEEIENNIPDFLDVCFSKNKKKSGLLEEKQRTIWNTISMLDEIISVFEKNSTRFSHYRKSKIVEEPAIIDGTSMRKLDERGIRWIIQNPNYLSPTSNDRGIRIGNRNYLPLKVNAYINKHAYDVYENQVILGFLEYLVQYVNKKITEINFEIKSVQSIPEEIVLQLPNTYELTGRCVYVFYKGIIEKLEKRVNIITLLYRKYEVILGCKGIIVNRIPKLTNTFKQIYHYRNCYEWIVKWFNSGEYSLEHLNYLFRLKTLSRLFEYYCLIKIQKAIISNGYVLELAERKIYDKLWEDNEFINNDYAFSNGQYKLALYYEPMIYRNKLNDFMNLYSTGYNFSKACWNDYWTPDFIIQIQAEMRDYYFIIDAKYSTFNNVKKRYMPELIMKYSAQIASKDKLLSDIVAIGAIYPNDNDKLYYYRKNNVKSSVEPLPMYFSVSVENGKEGDLALGRRLNEILSNVKFLEQGFVNDLVKENVNLQNEIKDIVDDEQLKYSSTINSKNCNYYKAGLCLVKKKSCIANNNNCDQYKKRNDGMLLVSNIDCRNIKFNRKGNLVCEIADRKGCIGQEKCGFYQKKKIEVKRN